MATEADVERLIKQVEKEWREAKRTVKGWAKAPKPGTGPARSVTVGPGETAIRSGDATSPATTTGHGSQSFPPAPRAAVVEALVLVNATALRIGRRYQRDPGGLAEELAMRANDLVDRVKLPFDRALEQVARELESDIAHGRR